MFSARSARFNIHFKIAELSVANDLIPPDVLASLLIVCSPLWSISILTGSDLGLVRTYHFSQADLLSQRKLSRYSSSL